MRQDNPTWKVVLAAISLSLTFLVWASGLQESFSRPSVTPKLSFRQQEMALLAEQSVPRPIRPLLIGSSPKENLRQSLSQIPFEDLGERERLLLAALAPERLDRDRILNSSSFESPLSKAQDILLSYEGKTLSRDLLDSLNELRNDPVLFQVMCSSLGGGPTLCIDPGLSNSMAMRLLLSQFLPLITVLFGVILLILQSWKIIRDRGIKWPNLIALPLSLTDMIILIAGGFVVLGEVISPVLVIPITSSLSNGVVTPISESIKVFVGYISMTVPALLILRQQINSFKYIEMPLGGWFQWKIQPWGVAFLKAFRGWVMVTPLVLLTAWLMNTFVGDQGGSNPLLELVLNSNDSLSLLLLVVTTVFLAPLFEELIFRGVLLPVLAKEWGRFLGVIISALVFALAHLSVGELPPLIVLGLGLGLLRLTSGRLFPCVLMHSLWNGVTFSNLLLLGG